MSILQDLWYGNIRPNEDKIITGKEKELLKLIDQYQTALISSLKEADLNTFKNYIDCTNEYASLIESQAFDYGFRLAIKILTNE